MLPPIQCDLLLGVFEKCEINEGEQLIPCIRNDENFYDINDVIGPESIEVALDFSNNQCFIPVGFGGIESNLKFDTGAHGIILNNGDFKKLIASGVQFRDLKLNKINFGVANIPIETSIYNIDNFKIGDYIVNNVVIHYYPEASQSLLGIGFLKKFSNVIWDMKKENLTITK